MRLNSNEAVLLLGGLCLSAALLFLNCGIAQAQPRTVYRPADIENARENLKRYEWARKIAARWERDVAFSLEQDRAFFEGLIPSLTPGTRYAQNCPHCVGVQSLMGNGRFRWSVRTPDQVSCRYCRTVYPNEAYPETGVLECPRMGQTFTYYETPEEKADPERRNEHAFKWLGNRPTMTSFSGLIRYNRASWAWGQALKLAKLHALTDDIACAERAAWILDRFARVYPNYLYHSYDGSVADWPPAEVAANMGRHDSAGGPRGGRFASHVVRHAYGLNRYDDHSTLHKGFWGAGRLSCHGKGSDAGPLTALTVAFDLIRDVRYPDGGRIVDEDVERRIVDNLIAAGCTDMENWDSLSNKGTAVLGLSAAVGRLLEQPERVRRALGGFNRMLEGRYHFDGFYSESPAYAVHNLSNTRELPDLLFGYTDPPGYQPEDGPRLIDHNPFAEGRFRLALESLIRMLAPGNHLPVIGDTHHETRLDLLCADVLAARLGGRYAGVLEAIQGAPLSAKGSEYALWYRPPGLEPEGSAALPLRSEWFPGWHVGVLRGGREKNDTALFLNGNENRWTLRTGHRHHDILSLSFYAFGEELVSDRGYFSGSGYRLKDGRRGQDWVRSAFSHNLVVVDEQDQARRSCGSSLELFGVSPGIEVVQASGVDVYPQCKQYRRTCALVGTLGDPIYAVDIFRVAGGQTHQYGFNCNGSLVSSDRADSAFRPAELSPVWTRWLRNAKAFRPEAPSTFTWQHGDVKLDLLVLNAKESLERVVVADAPGWRRARPAELEKPPIQQVLVENRSSGPDVALSTQYVTLIVPYRGATSPVLSAQLLENDPTSGVVAVEVTLEERTDRVISTLDQQQRRYGPATVAGQFAFCSTDGRSSAVQGYLLNGTQLECGELNIVLDRPNTTRRVQSVADRTYKLSEPVPHPPPTVGSYLLAGASPRTGFALESVTQATMTVRDYPAVACDQITVLNSRWLRIEPQGTR